MKINQILNEMPMGRMKHGGPYENAPDGLQLGKPIRGNMLTKGMKVAASYNQYNHGTDFVEIVGVTNNDAKYGEGGAKFDSVKAALQNHGVRSLKALEEVDRQNEYGYHTYLCVREIKPDGEYGNEGCWYYLFEGRWARGSGAEKLSFALLERNQETETKWNKDNYPSQEERMQNVRRNNFRSAGSQRRR